MTHIESRQHLYDTMRIKQNILNLGGRILVSNVPATVLSKTSTMFQNRHRYEAVSRRFPNPGLKWWLVALIHELECTQNFSKYLGNGQSWAQKTTIVPIGRGPFHSFEEGAIDALRLKQANDITDWSIGNVLYFLEGFNGYGYSQYHNTNSPYLWSGSDHYRSGKYVSDGKYSENAVSQQIGVALLLRNILARS